MDIKSWILLIGTLLIVAVICHGFWTAYRTRRNDVRMAIETDIPDDDLDDMVLLRGELPNGGARVTPTVGFEALRVTERKPLALDDPLIDEEFIDDPAALDEAVAFVEQRLADSPPLVDEGDFDAGYQPEQATLDLEMDALEERYAAHAAAARGEDTSEAPLLTDTTGRGEADSPDFSQLPPKKQITPERAAQPHRKQFEPPLPEEVEAQRRADEEQAALERAQLQEEQRVAAEQAELRRMELELAERERKQQEEARAAKVEAQRLRRLEEEERAAQAKRDAQARAEAKQARKEAQLRAQQRELTGAAEPEQLSLTPEPIVEFPDAPRGRESDPVAAPTLPPAEELVVLNVIAKTRPFHGGDVLELFLRNGIKFGDMNIFHRIDPVTKASQYSIASVTEPGYFDLRTMESLQFRGLCLFMQLPCSGQATKVFTDMLTVADKLARQLDAEVCDEQYNRLTRQSTEHYRQRVAEFTRRHMSKRA